MQPTNQRLVKILHITPAFYPASYWGGPIFSVFGLCNAVARMPDIRLRVVTTDSAGPKMNLQLDSPLMSYPSGIQVSYYRRVAGATFSPGLLLSLLSAIRWCDVVHVTGVFSSPTPVALLAARLLRKPVVWSPRGSLQDWVRARKPLLKRIWLWGCRALCDGRHLVLHATSEEEARSASMRLPGIRICTIANAVDVPEQLPPRQWRPGGRTRLLFLGRLDPKKGIENLLDALPLLESDAFSLTIAGTGPVAYTDHLRRRVDSLGLATRVSFVGHLNEEGKTRILSETDLCVIPSFVENYCLVVAEALAQGVPVVASTGTPWQEIESRGCGRWVDNDPPSLARAIKSLDGQDLEAMGEKGRSWIRSHHNWKDIGRSFSEIYRELARAHRSDLAHSATGAPTRPS